MTSPLDSEAKTRVVHVPNALLHLIPKYLQNRQRDLEVLSDALAKQDYDSIRRLGHSMKGSGGGFGFHEITTIGDGIEKAALDKCNDTIQSNIQELTSYLACIHVVPLENKPKA